MISRRLFLTGGATLILGRNVTAQPAKVWRIGYLAPSTKADYLPYLLTFREGMGALGYIEGQNFVIEARFADRRLENLGVLAQELVRLKVDVIVTPSTRAASAAKGATNSIPVVFVGPSDPVGSDLINSLAHPGGNVTGLTDIGLDLTVKRLEFLKQLVPNLKRVGALGEPADTLWKSIWSEAQAAARQLQIEIVPVLVKTQDQLEAEFTDLNRRVQALHVAPQAFFYVHLKQLISLASRARLPATYEAREYAEAGGLLSYGPSHLALSRRAAHYVDRIFKGARPADLPVEQPTEYELVINLKTAKALGIAIPESILLRADEVIR